MAGGDDPVRRSLKKCRVSAAKGTKETRVVSHIDFEPCERFAPVPSRNAGDAPRRTTRRRGCKSQEQEGGWRRLVPIVRQHREAARVQELDTGSTAVTPIASGWKSVKRGIGSRTSEPRDAFAGMQYACYQMSSLTFTFAP